MDLSFQHTVCLNLWKLANIKVLYLTGMNNLSQLMETAMVSNLSSNVSFFKADVASRAYAHNYVIDYILLSAYIMLMSHYYIVLNNYISEQTI